MADNDAPKTNSEPTEPTKDLVVMPDEAIEDEPITEPKSEPALADALVAESKHQPWPKRLWSKLTGTPKRTLASITGLIVVLALVIGLTPLKYPVLGWAFKSEVTIVVSDSAAGQVLPGAKVSIAGHTGTTDKTGSVHLTGIHPGATTIEVTKAAYVTTSQAATINFGDNGTRTVKVTSRGIRLTFNLTNYVTGKPVSGARVTLADADVVSDANGRAIASVSPADNEGKTGEATISLDGFNDAKVSLKMVTGTPAQALKLTPAGHVYYLSNRSGKIDLYQANLDGTDVSLILAGNGNENDRTGILANVYDQSTIALVSSRAGHRVNGYLQSDLYIFKPATKQLILIDSNIDFGNYRAWLGKTLMYQKNGEQVSSIKAYDVTASKSATIATCTPDHACPTALYTSDDLFVFSLSGATPGSTSNGLFVVKSGSTSAKDVSSGPAFSAQQQVKNTILLQYYNYTPGSSAEQWQSLNLETTKVSPLATGPSNQTNRIFVNSPGDKLSVSVDKRDGQSDLYLTDDDGNNERQLTKTGDVTQFVQWYGDDYIVYSAANQLYVVGVAGGDPHKITNFYSGSVATYSGGYSPLY